MFHIEQSMQLLIKAKLLDLKGNFERTHSLRKLLSDTTSRNFLKRGAFEALENLRKILWSR